VLRLLTIAFWQAGNLPAAGRAVRDWARAETDRPAAQRYASRIYEDMGAIDLAAQAAQRVADQVPDDPSAWSRVGRLRLRLNDREGAIAALNLSVALEPSLEALLDLALAHQLAGDVGAQVSAAHAATRLAPKDAAAWSVYAHALARTDRLKECIVACERALRLKPDPEVDDLLRRTRAALPHELAPVRRRVSSRS
jgi:tetratricopeptide (TPR) repeat protein